MDEITVAQLLVLPSLAQYSTGLLNVKNILNIRRPHDIPGYLRSSTPVGPFLLQMSSLVNLSRIGAEDAPTYANSDEVNAVITLNFKQTNK